MAPKELIALRKSCTPPLSRRDLACRMGISYTYLEHMENGNAKFPDHWKKRFVEEVDKYNASPIKENQYQKRWRLYRDQKLALA